MIKLITNIDEWAKAVSILPGSPYIATYTLSIFKDNGPVKKILSSLNQKKAKIVVGVPTFKSCTGYTDRCPKCLSKHSKSLSKMAYYRDQYKDIDWKFVKDSHAKFAVSNNISIVGGRNLSDSNFADINVLTDDKLLASQLVNEYLNIINNAYDIGTDAPLIFHYPYKGEIMADSTSIKKEYKELVINDYPQSDVSNFWKNA